jgi:hypothetical protein
VCGDPLGIEAGVRRGDGAGSTEGPVGSSRVGQADGGPSVEHPPSSHAALKLRYSH